MLLEFLNLFAYYIIFGAIIRTIISIFPDNLTQGFDNYILVIRKFIVSMVETIFDNSNNFEVLLLSRIIFPFIVFVYIQSFLLFIISYLIPFSMLNILIWIINIFIIINTAPSGDELTPLIKVTPNSFVVFFIKISILLSIPVIFDIQLNSIGIIIIIFLLLLPLSAIKTPQFNNNLHMRSKNLFSDQLSLK